MTKFYLDNKRFELLIVLYLKWDNKKSHNPHEEELMALFDLLITTVLDSFKFDVDKDDAKQECFLLILKKLRNFDPSNGSAFNYFTTVILNNLRLVYVKNKKYNEKLNSLFERTKDALDQT